MLAVLHAAGLAGIQYLLYAKKVAALPAGCLLAVVHLPASCL
jgi:hypothetical protein